MRVMVPASWQTSKDVNATNLQIPRIHSMRLRYKKIPLQYELNNNDSAWSGAFWWTHVGINNNTSWYSMDALWTSCLKKFIKCWFPMLSSKVCSWGKTKWSGRHLARVAGAETPGLGHPWTILDRLVSVLLASLGISWTGKELSIWETQSLSKKHQKTSWFAWLLMVIDGYWWLLMVIDGYCFGQEMSVHL